MSMRRGNRNARRGAFISSVVFAFENRLNSIRAHAMGKIVLRHEAARAEMTSECSTSARQSYGQALINGMIGMWQR
jgi:hypothetical protein